MLVSAVEVLRERGAGGLTIDAVLERSGAPRGSVYHHFPGGRSQILREALQFAGEEMLAQIDRAADVSAVELLRQIAAVWGQVLLESNYTAGSPVLAAALDSGQDDPELSEVAAQIFRHWRTAATEAYTRQGLAPAEATALAHTTIAALEGAVALSRAMRSLDPLNDVAREMS